MLKKCEYTATIFFPFSLSLYVCVCIYFICSTSRKSAAERCAERKKERWNMSFYLFWFACAPCNWMRRQLFKLNELHLCDKINSIQSSNVNSNEAAAASNISHLQRKGKSAQGKNTAQQPSAFLGWNGTKQNISAHIDHRLTLSQICSFVDSATATETDRRDEKKTTTTIWLMNGEWSKKWRKKKKYYDIVAKAINIQWIRTDFELCIQTVCVYECFVLVKSFLHFLKGIQTQRSIFVI